ncbi:threonylcarbamoyl-AMP synthase [Pontibacter sp. 172403-2]|uniref:L-threonylcarbamoyladenylate synthase n=1 Tax=Pontibacter rufus TaxID=2791028 RepID=UPI0018AFE700|nr:L-threonylcarbamoyladenylate synthase [Pontibacter sp. 172403-2]MBF9255374.1 threonylcarbamoyl-AMP synthase [Pontibacter sp. 172403-2]
MNQFLKEIQAAEEELLMGNVILYPTDTVWGLGCDAENAKAVRKIFEIKERPESKTMIVLVADTDMLRHYVKELPEGFEKLPAQQERPTTYVLPGAQNLPQEVIADDGTVAIRITDDEFCHKLIRQFGRPIISTSANVSGKPAAVSFADVSESIKQRVDHVVRWRQEEKVEAKPSRIVKIEPDGTQTVLRS